MQYHDILSEYVRDYAVPAMLAEGWAFKAAKSYAWKQAKRGPEYHVDQPLRTHILNGLFGLTRVLEYLKANGYYRTSETDFKRALVLYTLHDAYKDKDIARTRTGNSDFSVQLSALEELVERMHLRHFVNVRAEDIRAASISLLSPKVADMASGTPGISHILTFVHLADAFASQQTARDFATAENRLREISSDDAVSARQDMRMSKRLSISQNQALRPTLKFYYHELDDYRGLSTLLIHQATEEALAPFGFYPILYFANGLLYLGPENVAIDIETLRKTITTTLFSKIRNEASEESYTIAYEACQYGKSLKFRKDVYLFCSLEKLMQVVEDKAGTKKAAGFLAKIVAKRVSKKKYSSQEDFCSRFSIPLDADSEEDFAQQWNATYMMFMGIENIAEALIPGDTLEWLCTTFHTPLQVAEAIRQNSSLLHTGGVADHCLIIAYHWLSSTRFLANRRQAREVALIDVKQTLSQEAIKVLSPYDKEERRLAFVNEELGLQSDIKAYLQASLLFSFNIERSINDNRLKTYEAGHSRSHKRTCAICNRDIPAEMKSNTIMTDIAGQQATVFSNKLQPSQTIKNLMVWCPMCYMEFMLRKLSGQSYPDGSDYTASYRLYLYILPDYSFTPQLWEYSSSQLLKNFYPQETVVSRLVLRGSKDEPGLPQRWLAWGKVDQQWLEQVQDMFANHATAIKVMAKDRKRQARTSNRLTFSFKNPNYMLITYDAIVAKPVDKSATPTHVEVWAKALYAATQIHLLTGARVYITDKPYLNITRPEQMKTIIEMEGLHPLLTSLLPISRPDENFPGTITRATENNARLPIAALPVMLNLLAAIWEINAGLYPGRAGEWRNLDKQVASILEEVKTNYLAGATLYKMRERDKAYLYDEFTRACHLLLPTNHNNMDETRQYLYEEGYELMMDKEGGYLMSLAERITNASLQLYRPSIAVKGRAHRFEDLFRTGVEAIKNSANTSENEEELIARVAGTVIKRLERVIDGGGYSPVARSERLEATREFATLLVRDLFYKLCGQSISKLTHEENPLADGIYFLTFQKINQYWKEHSQQQHQQVDTPQLDDVIESQEIATSGL